MNAMKQFVITSKYLFSEEEIGNRPNIFNL